MREALERGKERGRGARGNRSSLRSNKKKGSLGISSMSKEGPSKRNDQVATFDVVGNIEARHLLSRPPRG